MAISEQAVANPADWTVLANAPDWRDGIGERTRQLWDSFSDDLKVALAQDAHDRLAAGSN